LETLILLPEALGAIHPRRREKKGIEMRIEHSLPLGLLGRRPIHVFVVGAKPSSMARRQDHELEAGIAPLIPSLVFKR
jgi:hypothetical protein